MSLRPLAFDIVPESVNLTNSEATYHEQSSLPNLRKKTLRKSLRWAGREATYLVEGVANRNGDTQSVGISGARLEKDLPEPCNFAINPQ